MVVYRHVPVTCLIMIMKYPCFPPCFRFTAPGRKFHYLIGRQVASNWYVFDGDQYDLIFAPVGMTYAMLVIGEGLADEEDVLKKDRYFLVCAQDH